MKRDKNIKAVGKKLCISIFNLFYFIYKSLALVTLHIFLCFAYTYKSQTVSPNIKLCTSAIERSLCESTSACAHIGDTFEGYHKVELKANQSAILLLAPQTEESKPAVNSPLHIHIPLLLGGHKTLSPFNKKEGNSSVAHETMWTIYNVKRKHRADPANVLFV